MGGTGCHGSVVLLVVDERDKSTVGDRRTVGGISKIAGNK
jgi:hypothetical protein